MKRIFIALNIEASETLQNTHSLLKVRLKDEGIRWTRLENIHITLAFLGDTEENDINKVGEMLRNLCSGFDAFNLGLKGTGVFRNYNDPRVIWIGIDPTEDLKRLNSLIIKGLMDSGIAVDEKPFSPHLTLGRIKEINDKAALKSTVEKYRDTVFQEVNVSEVVLYESMLLPAGPVYKVVRRYGLRA